MDSIPSTVIEALPVRTWSDPVVEAHGYPIDSRYVETFWLPILGPSATWALRRLARIAVTNDMTISVAELARALGLGSGIGRNSMIARTLSRLVMFGMARWDGQALAVRQAAAPLPARHLDRLTPSLRRAHERWEQSRALQNSPA